jgi:predicted NUDIX family NTP pyrophosphohydrolase
MAQRSAGILLYRRRHGAVEVLLVHPGGPFWARKDDGAWSIPKGEYGPGEDPLAAARREFEEETGARPEGEAMALGSFRQSPAKIVDAWAVEGEFDPAGLKSNLFTMEWPPRSGKMREVPEVDRAEWFTPDAASQKILKGQRAVLRALMQMLDRGERPPAAGRSASMTSATYCLFRRAILEEKQVTCVYKGLHRELCAHIIGHTGGEEKVLAFQFAGETSTRLPRGGEWRCFYLAEVRDARLRAGPWHAGRQHRTTQRCVESIDLDINVHVRKLRRSSG